MEKFTAGRNFNHSDPVTSHRGDDIISLATPVTRRDSFTTENNQNLAGESSTAESKLFPRVSRGLIHREKNPLSAIRSPMKFPIGQRIFLSVRDFERAIAEQE